MLNNLVISSKPYHGIITNIKIEDINKNGVKTTKYTFYLLIKQGSKWITVYVNEVYDEKNANNTLQNLVNNLCDIRSTDIIEFEDDIGMEVSIKLFFEIAKGNIYPKISWYKPYDEEGEVNA